MRTYIPRTLTYTDQHGERRVTPEQALPLGSRAVVVLGEPGMGKSELMRQLGERAGYHYVSARALVRRPPGAVSVQEGGVLVIDGIDEIASAREADTVHEVLAQLVGSGRPPFILSCRSAEWRGAAARHDISTDYGEPPLELRLDPLTEAEAEAYLAGIVEPDRARDVVKELTERSLEPFFGNPLTLRLIGEVVRERGELPKTRAELFKRSSDLLWREHDETRSRSSRSTIGRERALAAVGAACAALVLTGREAISFEASGRVAPSDLYFADVAALPGADALLPLLGSSLFVRPGAEDRVVPLHRAIAEYLGARWLAAQASEASRRRILSLLTFSGGVPASLRGLHAWLAHFDAELAPAVIAADPYGVLRYGDASELNAANSRQLLTSLQQLSKIDPFFRSEDWARHAAPSLARPGLLEDIRHILLDPDVEWQLRMLILDALVRGPILDDLATELGAILIQEGRTYSFSERRGAADALLSAQRPLLNWNATVRALSRRKSEDSRRLAVEVAAANPRALEPQTIADAALAYLGLLPGQKGSEHLDTVGPIYILARSIPLDQIPEVLDRLAGGVPPDERLNWKVRYELSELSHTLISRQLSDKRPDPLRLLSWMRITSWNDSGPERHQDIGEFLQKDVATRRTIQRHVLLIETGHEHLWGRAWRLGELDSAFNPNTEDILELLRAPEIAPPRNVAQKELWKDLALVARRAEGLSKELHAALRASADGDIELLDHLAALNRKRMPEWERERRQRDRARARTREKRWAEHRESYSANEPEIRAGQLGRIVPLSRAYLGRFNNIDGDNPRERIQRWLGDRLLDAALAGFEAVLHRDDLPSAVEVAQSYAEGRRWHIVEAILAGICERMAVGTGLDGISDEVILTARLGFMREHVLEKSGGNLAVSALDQLLSERPELFARYARLAIEPQLRIPEETHVNGLYQLLRAPDPEGVILPLAAEWLRDFPEMAPTAELEIIDYLSRHEGWKFLREAAERRSGQMAGDLERQLTWLTVAFLCDFERRREDLDAAAAAHPNLFWHIRNRGGGERAQFDANGILSLERLSWIVSTFRRRFPVAGWPRGGTTGSENAWDATRFLESCIRRIASDTSDKAITTLEALQRGPQDGYTVVIKGARADQRTARREADFRAPELDELAAVLEAQPPRSTRDLLAVALDALARVQRFVKGDEVDSVRNYYVADAPRDENECRDQTVILLRGELGFNIDTITERDMPVGKRADLALSLGPELQLPIEAKGQWHPKLWTAVHDQLDAQYTTEWRSSGAGLYLVFWFGEKVPQSRRLRRPPRKMQTPHTAEALQLALAGQIPEHRRSDLAVFVLDVSKSP